MRYMLLSKGQFGCLPHAEKIIEFETDDEKENIKATYNRLFGSLADLGTFVELKEIDDPNEYDLPHTKWDANAQNRATKRYKKYNVVRYVVEVNKNTEKDIYDHMQNVMNKQGYIKRLIREKIASD